MSADMEDIVIKVDNVSKNFVLPHEKTNSLKSSIVNIFSTKKKSGAEVQHALQGVSFAVKKGEFFGIVGRNGSGKSTMLKVLAEIYRPTKGRVWHEGKLVPFIELGVGFNPELTGRENVFLNGALLGFSRKEIAARYEEIVRFAELERFMDQKLKNYSSGMQVRLAFSMAVQADADILLIDEVLAVGDAAFQQKCLNYFYRLKKEGKTVVFISHDMDMVEQFCDRAVMIDRSKLVFEGSAHEVANQYRKMFADEHEEGKTETEKNRWGDGLAKIIDYGLEKNAEYITIHATIMIDEQVDPKDVICGFSVLGNAQRLVGTNTRIEGIDLAKVISNKTPRRAVITWKIPNIFANGDYSIAFGLESPIHGLTHDWIENALDFSVLKQTTTHHIVEPQIKTEIS